MPLTHLVGTTAPAVRLKAARIATMLMSLLVVFHQSDLVTMRVVRLHNPRES